MVDWSGLFSVNVPIVELIVRGSAMYFALYLLFRVFFRRNVGSIGVADVLLIVLIADAAQNGMAGDYRSVTEGMILVSVIAFWNVALDWLAYRFPPLEHVLEPRPLCLVKNGRILRANLRKEFISEDELFAKIREKGFEDLTGVKDVYMESGGEISVIGR